MIRGGPRPCTMEMTDEMDLTFEPVTGSDLQIQMLYDLLKRRVHTISHQSSPAFDDHRAFVLDHPYRAWFLVQKSGTYIGSVYVKHDNAVGVNVRPVTTEIIKNVLDFIRSEITPMHAKASMIPDYFYINVAASDKELQSILNAISVKKLQVSYRI